MIAIGLLVVLTGVFFLVRDEPTTTVDSDVVADAVEDPNRIELTPAGEGAGSVVVERAEEEWRLTEPVEARTRSDTGDEIEELFGAEIGADDIDLNADRLDDYGLTEDSAVEVAVYGADNGEAQLRLLVGAQISIPGSDAVGTYVQDPDTDRIYRAQNALGDFAHRSAGEFRTRKPNQLNTGDLQEVRFPGEAQVSLQRNDNGDWELAAPETEETIDQTALSGLVEDVADVTAEEYPDVGAGEAGLGDGARTVEMVTSDGTQRLLLGAETDGGDVYTRIDDGPIFTVSSGTADSFQPAVEDLVAEQEESAGPQNAGGELPEGMSQEQLQEMMQSAQPGQVPQGR